MPLPLVAAAICAFLALVLPSGRRATRAVNHHSHGNAGWFVLAGLVVIAAVAATANRARIHQVTAAPPPPQVTKITNTVIKYVPAPAGHPLLSGWGLVAGIGIGGAVVVCVAALVVHGVRSFS